MTSSVQITVDDMPFSQYFSARVDGRETFFLRGRQSRLAKGYPDGSVHHFQSVFNNVMNDVMFVSKVPVLSCFE